MKFIVVDPKGISVASNHHESGSVVDIAEGAALKAFLHFKQVIPREEEKQHVADPPDKEPVKAKK